MNERQRTTAPAPDHVAPELVFDFDYFALTDDKDDPHAALMSLDEQGVPDIFFSPRFGGFWVMRRYQDVYDIFRDTENFTTYPNGLPPFQGTPDKMLPFEADPPDHGRFRKILSPLMTPHAVRRLEALIRETAIELIEAVSKRGEADFVAVFASKFPPLMFLKLMDMPLERVEEFVGWAMGVLEGDAGAGEKILGYLSDFLDRKYAAPGDDWPSHIITATMENGETLTREEALHMAFFLFLAGLDTVKNATAHSWRYLATHPELQRQLVDDPSMIPGIVEEMLRFFAITNNNRWARRDVEFRGHRIAKGDGVLLLVTVANREEGKFPDSRRIDPHRDDNWHMTFGAGAHRCLGSNIARAELRISLEEWLKRIPSFRLREGADVRSTGGATMGLTTLPLIWEAA